MPKKINGITMVLEEKSLTISSTYLNPSKKKKAIVNVKEKRLVRLENFALVFL